MTIANTVENLVSYDLLFARIAVFKREYPNGIAEWTPGAQLWVLKTEYRRWLGWAWAAANIPKFSLSGANLTACRDIHKEIWAAGGTGG